MMKKTLKTLCLGLMACFVPAAVLLAANQVDVSAFLRKNTARVNEEIPLTIQIKGAQGNIQAPRLPSIQNVDSFYTGRSSNITFINGVSTSSVEFSYILIPRSAGQYSLNPIEVIINQQSYKTQQLQFNVQSSAGIQPAQQSPAPPPSSVSQGPVQAQGGGSATFRPEDDNIFVQVEADKTRVYPNQQILLTYTLYTRYDTRYEGFEEEPELSGFWIEEFPMDREIRRETVNLNGKRYMQAEVRKIALFPTAEAEYTIKPGVMKASIRQEPQSQSIFDEFFNDSFFSGSGFFSRRENRLLKPEPVKISVVPFPEKGKPVNFNGAVGNFRLTAKVDKTQAKQNEPVTLTVEIEGEGNIETLKQPGVPELKDFKVYESDSSSELYKTGYVIGGKKKFEIVFIPLKDGDLLIPKLSFSFFNPNIEQYQMLFTPSFQIHAEPSTETFQMPETLKQAEVFKKEVAAEGQDIHYIHDRPVDKDREKLFFWIQRILSGANIVFTLFLIGTLWQQRTEAIFSKDQALKRRKRAKPQVASKIRQLKSMASSEKPENIHAFFEEIQKALNQYLADKFNLSTYGTTRGDLERVLQSALGSSDPLYQKIIALYHLCDESRFGGSADLSLAERQDAVKTLKETVARCEKIR